MLFETSDYNAGLISEFVQAAPYPKADSLAYAIYKMMPNDTDLTITKNAGISGLNFAFADQFFDYHTMSDSPENIDINSVQHAGSYALALTQHFGKISLPLSSTQDAVYFNLIAQLMVSYSFVWAYIFAAFTAALLIWGVRQHLKQQINSSISTLFWLVCAYISLFAWVYVLIQTLFSLIGGDARIDSSSFFLLFYAQDKLFIAFSLLSSSFFSVGLYQLNSGGHRKRVLLFQLLTIFLALISGKNQFHFFLIPIVSGLLIILKFRKGVALASLQWAGLIVWGLLLVLCIFYMPEAAHMFTWPLAFALIFLIPLSKQSSLFIGSILGATLAIYWFTPLIYEVYGAIGLILPGIATLLFCLVCCLIIPPLIRHIHASKGISIIISVSISFFLILEFISTEKFDSRKKQPDSFFYLQDHSLEDIQSYWVSNDRQPADWSLPLFEHEENAAQYVNDISHFLPLAKRGWIQANTDSISINAPDIQIVSSEITNSSTSTRTQRSVTLKLTSTDAKDYISLFFGGKNRILSAKLNGKPIELHAEFNSEQNDNNSWWQWRYYGLPVKGIEISLEIEGEEDFEVKVFAVSWGFPQALLSKMPPRPDNTMPRFYSLSDAMVLFQQVKF